MCEADQVFRVVPLLLVVGATTAFVATGADAKKGWHRCQDSRASLCDGRGRVLFPYLLDLSESGGYSQFVSGFRQAGPKRGIVDTQGGWSIIGGDCGQNGVVHGCRMWAGFNHIRYRTSDGGRHWRPIRFHRLVQRLEGPGPDPPAVTGSVEDDPPLTPCDWSHARHHVRVVGQVPGFGNWCAPPDQWAIPKSLVP